MEVRDECMAGARLHNGDLVWIEPQRPAVPGQLVLARISVGPRSLLRVRRLMVLPGSGHACLAANLAAGTVIVASRAFKVIGPVTGTLCQLSA
jgi:SOS-response transcriptional repressor LexA